MSCKNALLQGISFKGPPNFSFAIFAFTILTKFPKTKRENIWWHYFLKRRKSFFKQQALPFSNKSIEFSVPLFPNELLLHPILVTQIASLQLFLEIDNFVLHFLRSHIILIQLMINIEICTLLEVLIVEYDKICNRFIWY